MTASTTPQSGYGTQIGWNAHDIGYLLDVDYSGITVSAVDVSSHESAWSKIVGGKLDGGELTIPVRLIPGDTTGQKALITDIKAKTIREVIITLPDSTTMTFDALATKFGDFTFPMDGAIDAVLTLKVDGEPTLSWE